MIRTKLKDNNDLGLGIILVVITLLGAGIRFFFVLRGDFPLNDGGMFYQMTTELVKNNFILPVFTGYNLSQIPFAYPPLPFYIAGLIHTLTGIDLLQIFQFLPSVFSILTIPAFFLLSRALIHDDLPAVHATLIFAILPPGDEWLIMGGGLVRAPAFLFSLLALWLAVEAIKTRRWTTLILAGLFSGLTALSHLEIFLMTFAWIVAAAIILSKDRWGALVILMVGCISGALSLPWWLIVLFHHGLAPFVNAMQSGEFSLVKGLGNLLLRNLTEEYLFTPILIFSIIGIVDKALKRDWLLPAWVLAVLLVDARSIERSLFIPLSMLAGITINDILLPALGGRSESGVKSKGAWAGIAGAILIAYIVIRAGATAQLYSLAITGNLDPLSSNDRTAFQWVRANLPPSSRFLVITPPTVWETNKVAEWFPVLTERHCVNTVQGNEWLDRGRFEKQKSAYDQVQRCVTRGVDCLEQAASGEGLDYTHIYLSGRISTREPAFNFQCRLKQN